MKAILLAGGKGTRLRPLTIHTPKPIVPIFDRPLLRYQIDLLRQVPEVDEVVLSLNYQPRRIEEMFTAASHPGVRLSYVVEPQPLGTAGAVKYANKSLDESVIVFNGDILTEVDLPAVLRLHRERSAKATIVLTPVEDPSAFGLVETDEEGNVRRFLEKPKPEEITCNTINAGIYILEPETFERIPRDTAWSIERSFFPSLVEQKERFVAYVYRGYWIDIGTPEKYMQVHRDIMDRRFVAPPFDKAGPVTWVSPEARIEGGVALQAPYFIDVGTVVKTGARVGPYAVVGRQCQIEEDAQIAESIIWSSSRVGRDASVRDTILGRHCHVGRNASLDGRLVLGDKSVVTDYSRL